ncbi:DUF3618 domain-containing protein [Sphingomonas aerophila]|uniref:DUF3618 domain-containing protein n=1 Tax=Sphingomonas aerophila TaxID=1344948 RepID=A0A7W9BH01_9SPHN|nr:DUF3618 domain-containing protein [Sphingomonas aerophila]MBB5716848.1 hypothetical protein [Sphingomonas aerophila]
MADATDDTDQIERDLAQTRERMDRRLDELGDRLAPNQLVNDALAHVTGGDGADFTQTLIAKAKANPIPAVLAGVGIAWLLASNQNKQSRARPADLPTRLRDAEAGVVRLQDEHPDVHASRVDDARGQVLGIARSASDTAASYGQRVKDAMASASQTLLEKSHDLRSGTSSTVARHGGARGLASNPVVLGSAAALVGLVAGALIPLSNQEEDALGNVAGQLRTKGRALAQDLTDRGAQVASDALGAVKDSAQAHGLTADKPIGELVGDLKSGELLGHVKQAAQEVASAGKESVQAQMGRNEGGQR